MDERLISKVYEYPELYDVNSVQYRDQRRRNQAWKEIGQAMKLPGWECKNLWGNLRNCFLNAIKRRRTGRDGQPPKKFTKWRYEDEMSFLLPFMEFRQTSGSLESDFISPNSWETADNTVDGGNYEDSPLQEEVEEPKFDPLSESKFTQSKSEDILYEDHSFQEEEVKQKFDPFSASTCTQSEIKFTQSKSEDVLYEDNSFQEEEVEQKFDPFSASTCTQSEVEVANVFKESEEYTGAPAMRTNSTYRIETMQQRGCECSDHDATEMFYLSMARTVKRLSILEQAKIRMELCRLVSDAEIRHIQSRSIGSLSPSNLPLPSHHN